MNYVETIPFKYRSKDYILLVQKKVNSSYTDFSVTAITNDQKSKIYVNYIFRWDGVAVTQVAKDAFSSSTKELLEAMWNAIYTHIILNMK